MPTSWCSATCTDTAEIYIRDEKKCRTQHTQSISLAIPFSHELFKVILKKKRWKSYKFIKNYFHCIWVVLAQQVESCKLAASALGARKAVFPHFRIDKYVWQCDMLANSHHARQNRRHHWHFSIYRFACHYDNSFHFDRMRMNVRKCVHANDRLKCNRILSHHLQTCELSAHEQTNFSDK